MNLVRNTNIKRLIRSEGRPRKQKFMLQNCYEFAEFTILTLYHELRIALQDSTTYDPPGCLNSGANCSLRSAGWEHLLAMENSSTARLQQRPKRTTSVRLENLERLQRLVRELGFKNRRHFFQMCPDALSRAHSEIQTVPSPP